MNTDKLRDDMETLISEYSYYEVVHIKLAEAMKDFQTGGKYSHHLHIGDNIILEGVKFLLKEYERNQK